ncbi:hypothetical protein F0562_025623 [Nyssa sinensis]|uniref:RNase H type-1 domain-containing protein n=1 Tax=Nyssa sinensis TaxID=561372 RepID=A0A5J5BCJ2_9ASTE|nr:hypothetical protein F0562_025623 [Nyssa sinensis]
MVRQSLIMFSFGLTSLQSAPILSHRKEGAIVAGIAISNGGRLVSKHIVMINEQHLESTISNCMGYRSKEEGLMVMVHINHVVGFIVMNLEALFKGLLEACEELRPLLFQSMNEKMENVGPETEA